MAFPSAPRLHHNFMRLILSFLFYLFAGLLSRPVLAQSLSIYHWPNPRFAEESFLLSFGNDPVVGRLSCPPLSRLNLRAKKHEELVLRQIQDSGTEWRLVLRSGLNWWNGDSVTAQDLLLFLTKELERIVQERSGGLWKLPSYSIHLDPLGAVIVRWGEQPIFGPWVFNGVSLFRKTSSDQGFECVGLHRLRQEASFFELIPRENQKPRGGAKISVFSDTIQSSGEKEAPYLSFNTATEFSGNPWNRPGDDQISCSRSMDMPVATMLAWRASDGPTADPKFRKILTQLIPRGALVRSGAGGLAELLTVPIPRHHPAYDSSLPLLPSDLESASQGLTSLGYKRPAASIGLRRFPQSNEELRLVIATFDDSGSLIQKVLTDAFQAAGIGVRFVVLKNLNASERFDGLLGTFPLDWPESDLLTAFHSRAKKDQSVLKILSSHSDQTLDSALEKYALSLTKGISDFGLLRQIHKRLYDLELVSMLMQHKVCLEVSPGITIPKGFPDLFDPDWFRRFITQL